MAPKASPDSLIHCASCGEDYSATYRKCPFCGAKNSPRRVPEEQPVSPADEPEEQNGDDEYEDGYVFDGQDAFDGESEDSRGSSGGKRGKRLADGGRRSSGDGGFSVPAVNWPRVITFLCSLVIIAAAVVILFTVVYPQLRDTGSNPSGPPIVHTQEPSQPPVTTDPPEGTDPVGTDPVESAGPSQSDPVTLPVVDDPPLSTLSLNRDDFTLSPEESFRLVPNFSPSDWSGTVTWTSSDTSVATVDKDGWVSNANTTTSLHSAVITASAGGATAQCIVYCRPGGMAAPSASPSAEPTDEPTDEPTTSTSPSGGLAPGTTGIITGADSGLRVRSGPGTSYDILASLVNGNSVTIISDAGGGWYEIRYSGAGGESSTGYIMGDYISAN